MRRLAEGSLSVAAVKVSDDGEWINAPRCGILRLQARVDDAVRKYDELGAVAGALGGEPKKIVAPSDRFVIGVALNPLVAQAPGRTGRRRTAPGETNLLKFSVDRRDVSEKVYAEESSQTRFPDQPFPLRRHDVGKKAQGVRRTRV